MHSGHRAEGTYLSFVAFNLSGGIAESAGNSGLLARAVWVFHSDAACWRSGADRLCHAAAYCRRVPFGHDSCHCAGANKVQRRRTKNGYPADSAAVSPLRPGHCCRCDTLGL